MDPLTTAAIIKGGTDFLGSILRGSKEPKVPRTPYDQRPQRRNIIGLQNYLLGFSPGFTPYDRNIPGGTWGGQLGNPYQPNPQAQPQLPASQGGPMQRGSTGQQSPWPGVNAGMGMGGQQSPWGGVNAGMGGMSGMIGMPVSRPTGGGTPANAGAPTSRFAGPQMNSQSGSNPMLDRMESYFGPLGTPTTALQQQSLGGISQFLNSNPYGQSNDALQGIMGGSGYNEANQAYRNIGSTNFGGAASGAFGKAGDMFKGVGGANYFGDAQKGFGELANGNYFGNAEGAFNRLEGFNPFGAAQSSMEGILRTNPGMQGMDALRPLLDRNLAAANQEGGRFGSANAILRSRAVDDNNLLAAQMYQRGVDQQIGAAGQYGQMGNSLIGARGMAANGLLGVGQGRMNQQNAAAQGQLGVGQGRLSQGLGAANGMLGVGQGQLGVGQLGLQGALGSAGGLAQLAMQLQGDRLQGAGQLATNQNALFGNMTSAYDTGQRQATQEAERQQQALAILLSQLGVAEQGSLQGRG